MKKFLISLSLIVGLFGVGIPIAFANSTSCQKVIFTNSVTACVNITNAGTNRRQMTTIVNGGTISNLRCDLMTPDSNLRSISSCNEEFSYDKTIMGRLKLWIRYNEAAPTSWDSKPNSDSERTYPQWTYDFNKAGRVIDTLPNNNTNTTNLNNFSLTTSNSTPATYQYINLNIQARDSNNSTITNFADTVRFQVYYGNAYSNSWTQTTSSSYYTMNANYNSYGYTFNSSNNGYVYLSSFIQFKNSSYDYKVRVYDANNSSIYKDIIFYVNNFNNNNNTNNGNLNNFSLTTSNSSPSTYQYVDLNIQARDNNNYTITNFADTVKFQVYYGNANSNSWTKTTSSSYYTMNSNYKTYGYTFNSNNNGYAYLSNFIQFKNSSYDYKVRVYDANNSSSYKDIVFYVNNSNNNTNNGNLNNFVLTTNNSSPYIYQYVNLNIQARDNNNDTITNFSSTVKFQVYYGNANANSWTKTTSSNYYTMNANYKTYGYTFNSSNNGYAYLSSFIQFKNSSYDYKVRVYDANNSSIYKDIIFYVNGSNNNSPSTVAGFTTSQLQTVQDMYNARDKMINTLKNKYPKLNTHTTWKTMSTSLKAAMRQIINNNSTKTYNNYDDFYNAFTNWYRYTGNVR